MHRLSICCFVLFVCGSAGCAQRADTAGTRIPPPGEATRSDDNGSQETESPVASDGYLQKVATLYEEAKAAGQTSADSTSEWITDLYRSASAGGANLAGDTADQVRQLYEAAKERGETTAADAKEWVAEDLQQHGSWRYRTVELESSDPAEVTAELNKWGADRWNCFWVDKQEGKTTFYLKRAGRSYLQQLPARELLLMMTLFRSAGPAVE